VKGLALRIDTFGNVITNVTAHDVPALTAEGGKVTIRAGNGTITKVVGTFAEAANGEPVGIMGSSGYLEIALNKDNAARTLGVTRGAEVTVETN
jgi:S-adenosylmethionine hydrolase